MKRYQKITGFFVAFIALLTVIASTFSWPPVYQYFIHIATSISVLLLLLWAFEVYRSENTSSGHNSERRIQEDIFFTGQLYKYIYQEPVTGLGSRFYLDNKLQHLLSEKERLGAFFLIELEDLKKYNEAEGYLAGNALLKKIADVLKANAYDIKTSFIARLGGSSFAILDPESTEEEVDRSAVCILHGLEEALSSATEKTSLKAYMGVVYLSGIKKASDLLRYADIALKKAKASKTAFAYAYYEEKKRIKDAETESKLNATAWEQYIKDLIRDEKVTLSYQPVLAMKDKKIISYEALLRTKEANNSLSEAKFIVPIADRYGITYELDRYVIQQVLKNVLKSKTKVPYAINLSASTIMHEASRQWLLKSLSSRKYRHKIILEWDDHTVLNHMELVKNIMFALKRYGIGFGLDYTGYDFAEYDYLKKLPFNYLKIDRSYMQNLHHINTQFFIRFLTRLAHELNIFIIAKGVETAEQWEILQSCEVDGTQGFFSPLKT